jgi:hypothetical protein
VIVDHAQQPRRALGAELRRRQPQRELALDAIARERHHPKPLERVPQQPCVTRERVRPRARLRWRAAGRPARACGQRRLLAPETQPRVARPHGVQDDHARHRRAGPGRNRGASGSSELDTHATRGARSGPPAADQSPITGTLDRHLQLAPQTSDVGRLQTATGEEVRVVLELAQQRLDEQLAALAAGGLSRSALAKRRQRRVLPVLAPRLGGSHRSAE